MNQEFERKYSLELELGPNLWAACGFTSASHFAYIW